MSRWQDRLLLVLSSWTFGLALVGLTGCVDGDVSQTKACAAGCERGHGRMLSASIRDGCKCEYRR